MFGTGVYAGGVATYLRWESRKSGKGGLTRVGLPAHALLLPHGQHLGAHCEPFAIASRTVDPMRALSL